MSQIDQDVHTDDHAEILAIDEHVKNVAAALPFPVELEADMGGEFVLQIMLGRRGLEDDEPDRATLSPGAGEKWWLDVEGGRESIESNLDRTADPREIAEWIAAGAVEWGSPAAVAAVSGRPTSPDFPARPDLSRPVAAPQRIATRADRPSPGSSLEI